jgi:Flp pilus assembly protein protease CpaA
VTPAAGETAQTIIVTVAIGILLAIAYGDVRTRRIPNVLAAAIAVLGLARMILAANPVETGHTLVASAAVFTAGFLLFWRGVFGGGDAKLIGAMALLIGSENLLDFFLLMSVCGGALAFAILTRNRFRPRRRHLSQKAIAPVTMQCAGGSRPLVRPTVPYGVAIAAAGVVMLILRPIL